MGYQFNPFTGNLDIVGDGGGGGGGGGGGTGDITAVTAGTGLSGGGTSGAVTLNLGNTAVTAGSYTYGSFTVDAQGRITSASSGTAPVTSVSATGPISSTGGATPTISTSVSTNKLLGRASAGTGVAEEITLGTNLSFSGNTLNAAGGGGGTPGGSDTQIQFNDGGAFGGDVDLTYNKTTNLLTTKGDVRLDDGGTYTTTLQVISQAANQTITQPAATGMSLVLSGPSTLAAYAGVDGGYYGAIPYSIGGGRLEFSNALGFNPATGALSCREFSTATISGNITLSGSNTYSGTSTLSGRFICSVAGASNAPAGLFSGAWRVSGGDSTNTKPQVIVEQSGATSNAWSTAGTGFGVNSSSTFTGRLADLQKNATSRWHVSSEGLVVTTQPAPAAVNTTATLTVANIQTGIVTTSTAAAVDMTLPTGTLMDGGIVGVQNDMATMWSVINTGPNTATLLAGADHTIVGAAAVATGTSGRFVSRRTGATTWITYRVS